MQREQRSKGHVTLGFSLVHELNDSTLRMCQYVLWSERTVLTYCRMHGEERKLSVQPALISMADYIQLSKTNSLDPNHTSSLVRNDGNGIMQSQING